MARLPRLYAPTVVQHVVLRPAVGRGLFIDDDSYVSFTALLAEAVRAHGIALHAYVLTPDELRLLATPADPGSLPRAIQAIGRRYVPSINRRVGHGGPLWSQRYRSTLIDAETYLLDSMRFIESRPVALGLVSSPGEWRWSSYGHHVGREQQALLSDHAGYWDLSNTPFERQAIYRALSGEPIPAAIDARISDTVERGWLLGDPAFVAQVEERLNRRSGPLPRGRPRVRER
jgi:putative transposase